MTVLLVNGLTKAGTSVFILQVARCDDEMLNFPPDAYEQCNAHGTAVINGGGGDEVLLTYTVKGNTLTTYQTPKSASEKPLIIGISLMASQLTEHSVVVAHSDSAIDDDVLIRK